MLAVSITISLLPGLGSGEWSHWRGLWLELRYHPGFRVQGEGRQRSLGECPHLAIANHGGQGWWKPRIPHPTVYVQCYSEMEVEPPFYGRSVRSMCIWLPVHPSLLSFADPLFLSLVLFPESASSSPKLLQAKLSIGVFLATVLMRYVSDALVSPILGW